MQQRAIREREVNELYKDRGRKLLTTICLCCYLPVCVCHSANYVCIVFCLRVNKARGRACQHAVVQDDSEIQLFGVCVCVRAAALIDRLCNDGQQ